MTEYSSAAVQSDDVVEVAEETPQVDAEPSEAVGAPDAPEDSEVDDSGQTIADRKLSDEAARWRVNARAAETKLAVAEARLEQMRIAEAHRIAATKLADPADLFLGGITIDRLLGEDGEVDPQLVDEAAETLLQQKPHWRSRPRPVGAPASAVNSEGRILGGTTTPTWAELLGKSMSAG
jgi:hypothetical protein